jgi:hypothetical protein
MISQAHTSATNVHKKTSKWSKNKIIIIGG